MEVSGNTVKRANRFVHWADKGEAYQNASESLDPSESDRNVLDRIKNTGRAVGVFTLSLAVKIPRFYSRERFISSLLRDDAGVRSQVHAVGSATDALWEDLVVTDESVAGELDVEHGSVVSDLKLARHITDAN